MKKTITKALSLAAIAAFALIATPEVARAEFITFTVVESTVPGTTCCTFSADLLNGGYAASLNLTPTSGTPDPSDGSGSGTWTETATATFSQYFLGPDDVEIATIGDVEPGGYTILGSLTSSGTYVEDFCGGIACVVFTFTNQTGTLGIDSDQNNTADIPLLTASGVGAGTGGSILFTGGPTGGTGSFISNFTNNTLAGGIAQVYWPTLALVSFITTISGDVNQLSLPTILGDVSVQFSTTQVPEPATLSLFGLGLVAVAQLARRRRAATR